MKLDFQSEEEDTDSETEVFQEQDLGHGEELVDSISKYGSLNNTIDVNEFEAEPRHTEPEVQGEEDVSATALFVDDVGFGYTEDGHFYVSDHLQDALALEARNLASRDR